ncbi:hypothetical protein MYSTI_02364 [Myxococcus stipitatus DSM 14675]|uniref:YlxP-like protein n=1 Tax=Myxococcus stipitatus (strain DSM 14675 / JCM 12634 / Mx s8) TaxID=1278073 RepID=L7U758_MYXSD|nr:DUF503 domain-containing protein [Myxococcus stipitatus]AGC43680.1 hypothetical protein MYSTI_02364 [Myxococcus stipitatus DSM 14675]
MFVGVARLTLQIPESGSLKAKRQVLRRVMDRVRARFNVAMAEVEDQDLWQKATLALSVVGNDRRHVDEQLEKVIHFIEEMYVAPLMARETEILGFGDQLFASGPTMSAAGARAVEPLDDEEDLLSPERAAEHSEAAIARFLRGERASLAEAEGLGDWERRHDGDNDGGPGTGRPSPSGGGRMTLDEARARARSLRNPRDWEKK